MACSNPPNYTPPCESDRLLSQLGRFFRRECDIARWSVRSGFGWVWLKTTNQRPVDSAIEIPLFNRFFRNDASSYNYWKTARVFQSFTYVNSSQTLGLLRSQRVSFTQTFLWFTSKNLAFQIWTKIKAKSFEPFLIKMDKTYVTGILDVHFDFVIK